MTGVDARLAEYTALKYEQAERIKTRNAVMGATLLLLFATAGYAIQAAQAHLLLAVPPVCAVAGWYRHREDAIIVAIRCYLRDELAPKLQTTESGPVLGWETGPRGRLTRWGQLLADIIVFVAPGLLTLTVWLTVAKITAWGVVAVAAGAALDIGLAALLVHHAVRERR